MTRFREGQPEGDEVGARARGDGETAGRREGDVGAGSSPHPEAAPPPQTHGASGPQQAEDAEGPGGAASDARNAAGARAAADAWSRPLAVPPSRPLPHGTHPYASESLVRVRYVETDQMGVVHHSHYFAWFEIGRTDFIRALGTSYAQLEQDGLLLAIAEASVRYLNGAHYDDVLVVHTRLERVQSRSVTFGYEVLRREPEPQIRVATATMKLIALDRMGTPRTLPRDFRRLLESVAAPPASGA